MPVMPHPRVGDFLERLNDPKERARLAAALRPGGTSSRSETVLIASAPGKANRPRYPTGAALDRRSDLLVTGQCLFDVRNTSADDGS
jgi:hypothetical protein